MVNSYLWEDKQLPIVIVRLTLSFSLSLMQSMYVCIHILVVDRPSTFILFILFLCGANDWTQGLTRARQAFYYWATTPASKVYIIQKPKNSLISVRVTESGFDSQCFLCSSWACAPRYSAPLQQLFMLLKSTASWYWVAALLLRAAQREPLMAVSESFGEILGFTFLLLFPIKYNTSQRLSLLVMF